MNFVAFDIETATLKRSSICQIGITEVIDGVPQQPKSWLVQPEGNDYDPMNIWIHGITPDDTKNSPSFPEVWKEVYPYLQGKTVVAHNTSFDMYALRDAFDLYNMDYPTFDYFCTLRIARYIIKGCYSYSLNVVLDHLNIEFEGHHRADCDSLGCAKVLLKCLELDGSSLNELEEKYNFHRGKFDKDLFIPHLAKDKYNPNSSYKAFIEKIQVDESNVDTSNYFYGKTVCFTGVCQYGVRKDLLLKVAQVGGIPTNSVTSKTDVLVVGQQDYRVVGEDGMSSKQEKAYKMLQDGKDIEILSETEFLSRI
jgi:DNA polymerase-3 subunit epsilon